MLMCVIRAWYDALIMILENTLNGAHEIHVCKIHVCKVKKIRDSQALSYSGGSITLMPHMSIDYSLRGKCKYHECMSKL